MYLCLSKHGGLFFFLPQGCVCVMEGAGDYIVLIWCFIYVSEQLGTVIPCVRGKNDIAIKKC